MDRGVTSEDRQLYADYIASKQPPAPQQPPVQGFSNGGSVLALMQPLTTLVSSIKNFSSLPSPELEPMEEPRPLPDVGGPLQPLMLDALQPDNLQEPKRALGLDESIINHLIPGYARGGLVEDEDSMVEYYKRLLMAMKSDEAHMARRLPQESLPQLSYPEPKEFESVRGAPELKPTATGRQRAIYARDYLVRKGIPAPAASGIVGNLWVETGGFDPRVLSGARRGDQGSAAYAAQWRGQRLRNLHKFAGDNPSFDRQLDFIVEEMNPKSPYRDAISVKYRNDILNAKTPKNAAYEFRRRFERAGTPHDAKRQSFANWVHGRPTGNYQIAQAHDAFANAPIPTPRPGHQTLIAGRPNVPIADPHKYLESLTYPNKAPVIPKPPVHNKTLVAGRPDVAINGLPATAMRKRPPGNPDAKGMARLAPPPSLRYRDPKNWRPVGNYVARDANRVNPKLRNIMKEAASTYDSPYAVEAFSGWRPNKKGSKNTSRHKGHQANAIDIRLVDKATGKALPNYQNPKYFREYEKFAQHARRTQMKMHPELADQFRFGGYFGAETNKKGVPVRNKYGSMDLMHFDMTPGGRMAAGSWEGGVNKAHRKFWGVESAGMGKQNLPKHIQLAAAKPPPPAPVQNGLNTGLAMGGVKPPPAPAIPQITPTIVPPMVAGNFAPPVVPPVVPTPTPTPTPVGGGGGIGGLIGGIASMIAMSAASSQPTHTEVHQQVPGKPYNVAEMRGSTKKQKDGKPIDQQDDEEDDPLRWLMTI